MDPGIDVRYIIGDGFTPFHVYCLYGTSVDTAEHLLSKGTNIESRLLNGQTPLMVVLEWGNERLIRCFISHGANTTSTDQCNRTPLHFAVFYNHKAALQLLLEHGADHTIKTNAGETLLHFAAHHGNLETLRTLCTLNLKGINAEDRTIDFSLDQRSKGLIGLSALQIAEQREDMTPEWKDTFRRLVRCIEDPDNRTRLHLREDDLDLFEDALEHQDGPSPS